MDKSWITVMCAVNLTGSHKVWPVVVHNAAHPQMLQESPEHERWSGVLVLTTDWLTKHCIPDAKAVWQFAELGIPFKMMLVLDNIPSHPHVERRHSMGLQGHLFTPCSIPRFFIYLFVFIIIFILLSIHHVCLKCESVVATKC